MLFKHKTLELAHTLYELQAAALLASLWEEGTRNFPLQKVKVKLQIVF